MKNFEVLIKEFNGSSSSISFFLIPAFFFFLLSLSTGTPGAREIHYEAMTRVQPMSLGSKVNRVANTS